MTKMTTIKQFWEDHSDIVTDNFLNVIKSDFSEELKRVIMKKQLKELLFGLDELMEV